jgi:transposase-like protein
MSPPLHRPLRQHLWVQRFLPLFGEVAWAHRHTTGDRWRVDETSCLLNGPWTYLYCAIDHDGQGVDAYFSTRRNAVVAQACFERAIATTGARPRRVTADKAKCYPPALRAMLPHAEHQRAKYRNNGVERDHGFLKQRLRPMHRFKQGVAADTFVRGHILICNLRGGFSTLTAAVPRPLRLATAWPQLAAMI